MSATTLFAMGTAITLVIGLGVVWYVRPPLGRILVELCGNEGRAAFWTAFSSVVLGTVPVIFAIACRPAPGPDSPAVFELADQVKWGLIGMTGSLMALGWVIGRSIVRFELRDRPKS